MNWSVIQQVSISRGLSGSVSSISKSDQAVIFLFRKIVPVECMGNQIQKNIMGQKQEQESKVTSQVKVDVKSRQVKSHQVTSSHVKSSQVKSNQVKSSQVDVKLMSS